MAKQLQITIPEPCHENWDAMTPVEKGRFCGACQKQVTDFTSMSDRQLAEFFKKPSNGSGCGRFLVSQLEREINIPRKRIPWLKYFFTISLPAFLLSLKPGTARAQGVVLVNRKVVEMNQQDTAKTTPVEKPLHFTLSGVVTDENGNPLSGVSIRIKGTRTGVAAGNDGKFRILVKTGDVLVAASLQMETTEVSVTSSNSITIIGRKPDLPSSNCVVIVGGYSSATRPVRRVTGFVKDEKGMPLQGAWVMSKNKQFISVTDDKGMFTASVSRKDVLIFTNPGFEKKEVKTGKSDTMYVQLSKGANQVAEQNKEEAPALKLYPNPVKAGSSVMLELNAELTKGSYQWLLQGVSGQIVHQQGQRIPGNQKEVSVTLPAVAPGNYFLVLLDPVSAKRYSLPLVIIQ